MFISIARPYHSLFVKYLLVNLPLADWSPTVNIAKLSYRLHAHVRLVSALQCGFIGKFCCAEITYRHMYFIYQPNISLNFYTLPLLAIGHNIATKVQLAFYKQFVYAAVLKVDPVNGYVNEELVSLYSYANEEQISLHCYLL